MEQKNGGNTAASQGEASGDAERFALKLPEGAKVQEDRRQADRRETDRRVGAERRRSERVELDARASIATSSGSDLEAKLENLSAHGCRIRLAGGELQVEDRVWLKLESVQPWTGTVRWTSQGSVGIEFEVPFHRSIFELISKSHKSVRVSKAA